MSRIEIIKPRETVTKISYRLNFYLNGSIHFSFPCDANGTLNAGTDNVAAFNNYNTCINNPAYTSRVEQETYNYRTPAVGRCHCGATVELDGFTNTCDRCHRDYNSFGQELAPRHFWGEETGESASDVLNNLERIGQY